LVVSCGGDNSGLVRVDAVEGLGKDFVYSDNVKLELDREIRMCQLVQLMPVVSSLES